MLLNKPHRRANMSHTVCLCAATWYAGPTALGGSCRGCKELPVLPCKPPPLSSIRRPTERADRLCLDLEAACAKESINRYISRRGVDQ